ncbi:MAG: hypothetical protein IKF58_15110 [Bacillus sp. (in: Bacteria)]|nr:hypothetical protein [Bacillus sp. (in: firmicutes)]
MAGVENIVEHNFKNLTAEEQRKIASQGGKASAKKRAEIKTLKELLRIYGSMQDSKDSSLTNDEAMVINQYNIAKSDKPGSTQAASWIRDTKGEKPHEVVETPDIEYKPLVDLTKRKKNGES